MEELCHLNAVLIKQMLNVPGIKKKKNKPRKKECLELFEP